MCLSEAGIEALDIFGALDLLDTGLAELEVASVGAVVQQANVSIDLEALELKSL